MKKLLPILLIMAAIAAGYWVYTSYFAFSDVTKPWWKGEKLIIIAPLSDPSNSFEAYAESDGTNVTKFTIYGADTLLTDTECGNSEIGRYCLVTATSKSPEGITQEGRLRIRPHPTGKIDG